MDKKEYQEKLDDINRAVAVEDYTTAAGVADAIDWKRVRNVQTLLMISEIYEAENRYEDSKNLLMRAYRRSPLGRTVLYRLVECTIALKQFDEAIEYYSEYCQAAPKDNNRYILKYKIYRGRGSSLEEQIDILKQYLEQEKDSEKWSYELAKLYKEAGRTQECINTCDDLVLWYQSGKYVIKALELKKKIAPLTPRQQEIYDHRFDDAENRSVKDERSLPDGEEADPAFVSQARAQKESMESQDSQDTAIQRELAEDISRAAQTVQEKAAASTEETKARLQGKGFSLSKEPELLDDPEGQPESGLSGAEIPQPGQSLGTTASPVSPTGQNGGISYDEQSLQEDLVRSMREIVDGVGARNDVDEEESALERVIDESKEDQEAAVAARGARMTMEDSRVQSQTVDLMPNEPNIDDILLSMNKQIGRAQQESGAAPVLSASEEAAMNDHAAGKVGSMYAAGPELTESIPVRLKKPEAGREMEMPVSAASPLAESQPKSAPASKPGQPVYMSGTPAFETPQPEREANAPQAVSLAEEERAESSISSGSPQAFQAGTGFSGSAGSIPYEAAKSPDRPVEAAAENTDGEMPVSAASAPKAISDEKEDVAPIETRSVSTLQNAVKDAGDQLAAQTIRAQQNLADATRKAQSDVYSTVPERIPERPAPIYAQPRVEYTEEIARARTRVLPTEEIARLHWKYMAEEAMSAAAGPAQSQAAPAQSPAGAAEPAGPSFTAEPSGPSFTAEPAGPSFTAEPAVKSTSFSADHAAGIQTDFGPQSSSPAQKSKVSQDTKIRPISKAAAQDFQNLGKSKAQPFFAEGNVTPPQEAPEGPGIQTFFGQTEARHAEPGQIQREVQESPYYRNRAMLKDYHRDLFRGFLGIGNLEEQIANAIDQAESKQDDRTSRTGNVLILGAHGCGKTTIATGIAKAIAEDKGTHSVKMARIYAADLNRKDIAATIAKIAGGVLIIEEAGDLEDGIVDQITTAMEFRTDGMIVILEDEQRYVHDLLMRHPRFTMKFTSQIYIPAFTTNDLLNFGQIYAKTKDYVLSDKAADALAGRINAVSQTGEAVSITNVIELVDRAIHNAGKLFRRIGSAKKRYDTQDRIILREKDFK